MANHRSLRDANAARQDQWDPEGTLKDWAWRVNEMAGEAGEVCNILKKLHREKLGLPGSRSTKAELADELADVIICVDLCGLQSGTGPFVWDGPVAEAYLEDDTYPNLGMSLMARVGAVAAIEYQPDRKSLEFIDSRLRLIMRAIRHIAVFAGVNLSLAVPSKFNHTSAKVGLDTTLRVS